MHDDDEAFKRVTPTRFQARCEFCGFTLDTRAEVQHSRVVSV